MKIGLKSNPTLIGSMAVIVWGMSLPLNRYIATAIGIPALMGTVFSVIGALGLLNRFRQGQGLPDRQIFLNPLVYVRWVMFVCNPACVWTAAFIVQKPHLPLVILINYLWPTSIILFSILIAGVKVTRKAFFFTGTMIVLAALAIEILQTRYAQP